MNDTSDDLPGTMSNQTSSRLVGLTKITAQNEMENFRPNVLVLAKKACPRAPQKVPAASREVMMDSLDVDR